MKRACGVLLPISSLPSPYGIGTFSKEAYEFVDYLSKAGQSYWQILPLGPTSYGDSPYQSLSAFAGNLYYIDLDKLVEEEFLSREEIEDIEWFENESYIDYGKLYDNREKLLKRTVRRNKDLLPLSGNKERSGRKVLGSLGRGAALFRQRGGGKSEGKA